MEACRRFGANRAGDKKESAAAAVAAGDSDKGEDADMEMDRGRLVEETEDDPTEEKEFRCGSRR